MLMIESTGGLVTVVNDPSGQAIWMETIWDSSASPMWVSAGDEPQ